jgi:glycosyltransferase involved in cell wall biosynthesis
MDTLAETQKRRVVLLFRKLRAAGNFSIETSFEQMMRSFPPASEFIPVGFASSHYSNGILPRLRGMFEARRRRGDVNHVTGDVHYLALALPGRSTVLTVHDCGFMTHPNPVARRVLKWLWLDWPVRHCRFVTAVSEATKRDIVRFSGCDPDKVVVIPTVIAEGFEPVGRAFNAACPRILHVGMTPNKNFARHVEAIAGLPCELHIVGRLEREHVALLERHRVRYTAEHNISREDMRRAYAGTDLLLFASTLEGFGMPILEAQSVGRPVVTSKLSSMPEVAGAGACLVDPLDVASIRAGVMRVIGDQSYRSGLVEAGFANLARFRPDAVARQYEALYRRVLREA